MKKTVPAKGSVNIGKMRLRGRVLRDLIHSGGPINIEELDVDADLGGDAINSKRKRKPRKAGAPKRSVIAHMLIGAASIGGMVAASGVTFALGWG